MISSLKIYDTLPEDINLLNMNRITDKNIMTILNDNSSAKDKLLQLITLAISIVVNEKDLHLYDIVSFEQAFIYIYKEIRIEDINEIDIDNISNFLYINIEIYF